MKDISSHLLLCTTNDPESLLITKIARALFLPILSSAQQHGARLSQESHLFDRVREMTSEAKTIVIVEIPGPDEEGILRKAGYEVVIIDHHTYPNLNRMQPQSSLEQFLHYFEISDENLLGVGFEPYLVKGVGCIDRGFLWELQKDGYSDEEARQIREYYVALEREVDPRFTEVMQIAKEAWEHRELHEGIWIIRSSHQQVHIRNAISFLFADAFPHEAPPAIIVEGDGKITLQDHDRAKEFFTAYGGYLFGMETCWGITPEMGVVPTVDALLARLSDIR